MNSIDSNSSQYKAQIVLKLLRGEITEEQAGEQCGVDPSEIDGWKELYLTGLESGVASGRPGLGGRLKNASGKLAGAMLVTMIVILGAGTVFSQTGNCPDGLFCFSPNSPAKANEVNDNFKQIVDWIQLKVGAKGEATISTSGIVASNGSATLPIEVRILPEGVLDDDKVGIRGGNWGGNLHMESQGKNAAGEDVVGSIMLNHYNKHSTILGGDLQVDGQANLGVTTVRCEGNGIAGCMCPANTFPLTWDTNCTASGHWEWGNSIIKKGALYGVHSVCNLNGDYRYAIYYTVICARVLPDSYVFPAAVPCPDTNCSY